MFLMKPQHSLVWVERLESILGKGSEKKGSRRWMGQSSLG